MKKLGFTVLSVMLFAVFLSCESPPPTRPIDTVAASAAAPMPAPQPPAEQNYLPTLAFIVIPVEWILCHQKW